MANKKRTATLVFFHCLMWAVLRTTLMDRFEIPAAVAAKTDEAQLDSSTAVNPVTQAGDDSSEVADNASPQSVPVLNAERITMPFVSFHDTPLPQALDWIAQRFDLQRRGMDYPDARITLYVRDISLDHLLRLLCAPVDLACWIHDGQLESAPETVFLERYGYGFEDNLSAEIFSIHHLDLSDARDIVGPLLSQEGHLYFSMESRALAVVDKPVVLAKIRDELARRDIPTIRKTIRLRYLSPTETAEALRRRFDKRVDMVIPDEAKKEILLIDDPAEVEAMARMIEEWDRPQAMHVTLKAMRVILSEEHRRGLDWPVILSQSKPLNITDMITRGSESIQVGFLSSEDLPVLEEALETVGTTVTSPASTIRMMTHTPVSQQIDLSDHASVVQLPESSVTLDILQEEALDAKQQADKRFSLLIRFEPIPDAEGVRVVFQDASGLSQNKETVALVVPKGAAVIIGGLLVPVAVTRIERWPFLGRLPFLGGVFSSRIAEDLTAETIVIWEGASVREGAASSQQQP